MFSKYTIFKPFVDTKPQIYHNINGIKVAFDDYNNLIAFISKEDSFFKVALYDKELTCLFMTLYISANNIKEFNNEQIRYIYDKNNGFGIMHNNIKIYSSSPTDTIRIPTIERTLNLMWRRVYKNYYLITIFRYGGRVTREELMTGKDARDVSSYFGNSSKDKYLPHIVNGLFGTEISINFISSINNKKIYEEVAFIPVNEKNLLPDFPKNLVRWFP